VHDENIETQFDFLQQLAEIGFLMSRVDYLLLSSLRCVTLIAEKGKYPRSFVATQLWAWAVKGQMCEFDEAMHYGMLSNTLAERQKDSIPGVVARMFAHFYSYVHHWKRPPRESLRANSDAFQTMWNHGDVDTVLLEAVMYLNHLFAAGEPLQKVLAVCERYSEAFVDYQQMTHWHICSSQHQAILNLVGRSRNPSILSGIVMDSMACQEVWKLSSNAPALFNFQFWSMVLGFHFGDLHTAKRHIKAMRRDLFAEGPSFLVPLRLLYTSLVYFALFRNSRKGKYRKRALGSWKQLQQWASKGAVNCRVLCQILEAEDRASSSWSTYRSSSTSTGLDGAMKVYDQAIQSVTEWGLVQLVALVNELAGTWLLCHSRDPRAGKYLSRAIECYEKWGAMAIVQDLKLRHSKDIQVQGQ